MFRKKKYDYDLIVIGSGAGGSVGAHYAVDRGKKVAIFEKDLVGGECPNFGCVPTKALLFAAEVYENTQNASFFGINIDKPSVDFSKLKEWKDLAVQRTGAAHGDESFKHEHIHLIKAKAKFISPHEVEADGKTYSAGKFILATGSETFIPPIEGLKETGYVDVRQLLDYKTPPESLFILGGGPIGCEFAQFYSTFGIRIIIADALPKLVAREDSEVSDLVQALFENKGIEVQVGVEIFKIDKRGDKKAVHFKKGGEEHFVEVDEILVATGKRGVVDFDPEKAGIKLDDKKRLKVNKYLQTNVPHIFAAGDVVGPFMFTHTGYYQSYIASNNAFSRNKLKVDHTVVPRCTFVRPEVASVGLSEYQIKESGIKYKKGMAAVGILGRANTSNEFDGFVKVLTDKNGVIIGASIVSPRAGEMIHELALAIKLRAKAQVLADMMHAYPTFSEAIKVACANVE
jgi:mercuric reductase